MRTSIYSLIIFILLIGFCFNCQERSYPTKAQTIDENDNKKLSKASHWKKVWYTYWDGREEYNPCTEEFVKYEGRLKHVYHVTLDANGKHHVHITHTPQDLKGYGLETGIMYLATGVEKINNTVGPGWVYSYIGNIHFVSAGNTNNYIIKNRYIYVYHINGDELEITVEEESSETECR